MNINIKNINNVINHINSIKRGTYKKQGICILIGAGADISSGGLLFRELKLLFLKENGCIVPSNIKDKLLDKKFEEQIEKMSQDSRCETLDKIMKRYKTPAEGYLLLVMLAEMGFIDAVITTNFDYLLEETQKLLNTSPFTIFTPGRAMPEEYYLQRNKISPIYLKMHGDLSDRLVTHLTQSEIQGQQYGDKFIKLFNHIIQNNSLIVIGYGGYDNLITEIFKQEIKCIDEVYWCNVCEPNEDSDLAKVLERENKLYFVNTSFDNLFQELAKVLLKDAKLKNTNPIFLPTVVQSKIDNQSVMFREKFEYENKVIERVKQQEKLESFLATFDNKCIAVIGEYKFGKSCFIYKAMQYMQDITFFPITCDHKHSILESLAQALGYYTDVPFPVMYSFVKWWNKQKKQLVFVIDDFFNADYFHEIAVNQIIDFFNFIYIVREFKYIQFIICFQSSIYDELEKGNTFAPFGNIISGKISIEKLSEDEVVNLLKKNGINENIHTLKKQELLYIPYVWEIVNQNSIVLTKDRDFFAQFTDAIYNISTNKYNFTKHAFNTILKKLAYNQVFDSDLVIDKTSQEYIFLQERGILNINSEIVYLELAIYFCKQYILKSIPWRDVVSETIIPDLQVRSTLTDTQLDVYVCILAEIEDIDQFDVLLENLDSLITTHASTIFIKKLVVKVLQKCFKCNQELFECYLQSVDITTYSFELQYYLFKVCAEQCPQILKIWNRVSEDHKLPYAAFVLCNDIMYNSLKEYLNNNQSKTEILEYFKDPNGLIKLAHILTYWGWDNISSTQYLQLKSLIVNEIFPIIKTDNTAIQYFVDTLIKYAYNIFFNAGMDFEEQFINCRNQPIYALVQKVLEKKPITKNEYSELLKMNININNSWLFVISNIIVVQFMRNQPLETYNMLFHFWDNEQFDVQVQHLDFFLSSAFWSLYINEPCDRKKFVAIFEKTVEKFERILFMFPTTKRNASLLKFSEEFDRMFEDGFNPMAFYFYTAPYKSLTTSTDWNYGKTDLKIYWDLIQYMSDLGKYDDMLRIVHALGQMISIYPKEGYDSLENLAGFEQPVIKRGIIRIFKENYLRYSRITKKELEKPLYHFDSIDIDEIIYNSDFLLENRTMEQLHWGRLFYNLEQLMNIDVSEIFLSNILQAQSCSGFLHEFIKSIIK